MPAGQNAQGIPPINMALACFDHLTCKKRWPISGLLSLNQPYFPRFKSLTIIIIGQIQLFLVAIQLSNHHETHDDDVILLLL